MSQSMSETKKAKEPMTKNWTTKELMKWLTNHPISAHEDVLFLCETITEQKAHYAQSLEEAKKEKQLDDLGGEVIVSVADTPAQSSKAGQGNIPSCV